MTDKPNKPFEERKAKINDFIARQVTEDTKAVSVVTRNGNKFQAVTLDLEKSELNFMDSVVAANWREIMAHANDPVTHQMQTDLTPEQRQEAMKKGDFSKMEAINAETDTEPLKEVAPTNNAPPKKVNA